MGSIASVLQWHCEQCSLINPTEKINCVRCGSSRDGENIGWIGEDGDVRENSDPRGAASPPTPSSSSSIRIPKQTKTYSTWGHFHQPSTFNLRRSASFCTLIRRWQCEKCFFANVTVCSSCIGCGYVVEKDYLKTTFKKKKIMDSFGSDWFSANHDPSPITPVETVDSPKKQLPSMYERVKNKVSRSLSNGSVVQKLLLENSPKGAIFKRPTSLLVDNSSPSDVNKNVKEESDLSALYAVVNKSNKKQSMVIETWTCPRCTLENSVHFDRCEVCETPKKKSLESTIPKNGVVITVPEWDNTDVDVSKQTTALYKSIKLVHKPMEPKMSPAEPPKPLYRRCYSEVNTPSPEGKVPLNRRSMIETDVQNNLMLKSPLSNANGKVGLRYSYIGITEPELRRQYKELRCSSPVAAAGLKSDPCNNSEPTTDIAVINTMPAQDWQSVPEWSSDITKKKRREFFEALQSDLPTLDARSAMAGQSLENLFFSCT